MPTRGKQIQKKSVVTTWAARVLEWCREHPLPGIIGLSAAVLIGLFAIAQGIDWFITKVDRPTPRLVEGEKAAGGNFSVTIENPTDVAIVVTEAVFRAEPPPDWQIAGFNELRIPAVTYRVPYDCSPGTSRTKLNPPFKVPAKDVAAVVFVSTLPMQDCQLHVALQTSHGQTKEQEAVSLARWQQKAP